MPGFDLLFFPDAAALSRAAANAWLDKMESRYATGPHYVALSGGRIARHFFDAVADLSRMRGVSLKTVHFFWADERCVPPSDTESNFALAERHLLKPLDIAADHVHRIRAEELPAEAAQAAEAELRRIIMRTRDGTPELDVVFLGMGEDGHVASLFPGTEAADSDALYVPVTATKPPPHRISLTYGAIAAAAEVWVLASGPGKEAALRASLAGGKANPLGRILTIKPTARIFTDIDLSASRRQA